VALFNRQVFDANEDVVCFMARGLEPLSFDWLDELTSFAIQNEIGVVGGRVLNEENRVADGGMIVGTSEFVSVAFNGWRRNVPDTLFRNCVIGNYSAVSLACMAMRCEVFREIGGFDDKLSSLPLLAADLCLRARELSYRIVFDPFVEFRQSTEEQLPSPSNEESSYFRMRWKRYLGNDPSYNPNLSYNDGNFKIKV
jgi:GT2 family glycosyltransferase